MRKEIEGEIVIRMSADEWRNVRNCMRLALASLNSAVKGYAEVPVFVSEATGVEPDAWPQVSALRDMAEAIADGLE